MVSQSKAEAETETDTSSYMLHNENCFYYLQKLEKIPDKLPDEIKSALIPPGYTCEKNSATYDKKIRYADCYTQFLALLEDYIEKLLKNTSDDLTSDDSDDLLKLDKFIISIYNNENDILNKTYQKIKPILIAQNPSSKKIEGAISELTKDTGTSVNTIAQSPAQAGSVTGRLIAMMSDNFKPQQQTSIPTVRTYSYSSPAHPTEYRFGTQGQRHMGVARVSPLFEFFLKAKARKSKRDETASRVDHIYFNNLGRDRNDAEGKKEVALTVELEKLEQSHLNIAVITLPADKGFMSEHAFESTVQIHDSKVVMSQFLEVAMENKDSKVPFKGDFHISDNVRNRLFPLEGQDEIMLNRLIIKSFNTLGISQIREISDAERQAVWFHFIKFELTNHIIQKLKPNGINFSCKDAIDRGGVSSAYYNLLKSFESESKSPMTRDEFECGLHAAPTMVKGRGMNHHLNLIWNTVDAYVTCNYNSLKKDEQKNWLIQWRDMNCPHARVEGLLKQRVDELIRDLDLAHPKNATEPEIITKGRLVLKAIQDQSNEGVSGKRLLLETATLTAAIALSKNTLENYSRYSSLTNELTINFPTLTVVCGLMKAFLGIILLIPSLGQSKGIIQAGWSTVKAGMFSKKREEIKGLIKENPVPQTQMKQKILELRSIHEEEMNKNREAAGNLNQAKP